MKYNILTAILCGLSVSTFGAGLVSGTLSPVGGTGDGTSSNTVYDMIQTYAPTNGGQNASQVAAQIANSNSTVFAGTYIGKSAGTGSNNVLGTLTEINGKVSMTYMSSGLALRSNSIAPFNWTLYNTNGSSITGTGSVALITNFDIGGFVSPGFNLGSAGDIVNAASITATAFFDNNFSVDSLGNVQSGNMYVGGVSQISTSQLNPGTATAIAGITSDGKITTNSANSGTLIAAGTLPRTAADTSWMSITNAVAITNPPATAGQALVVVGTNTFGAVLVKATNWPSGGSSFPLSSYVDANQFGVTNNYMSSWRTNDSGSQITYQLRPDDSTLPFSLRLFPAGDLSYAAFNANALVAQGNGNGGYYEGAVIATNAGVFSRMNSNSVTSATITATGGTVSIIPTNGAPVYTSNGLTASLPFGLTNTLAGRAQYLVGYYLVDAVGGVPILTVSNELDGYKYPIIATGSSSNITPETNWFVTPILSTNTVLRVRDESAGTGASVGIISSKQIGL